MSEWTCTVEVGQRVAMDNPGAFGEDDRKRAKRPPRLGTILKITEGSYFIEWDDWPAHSVGYRRHAFRPIPASEGEPTKENQQGESE